MLNLENPPGLFKSVTQLGACQGRREWVVADGNVLLSVVGLDHALGDGADHNTDGVVSGRDEGARLSWRFGRTVTHQDLSAAWNFKN